MLDVAAADILCTRPLCALVICLFCALFCNCCVISIICDIPVAPKGCPAPINHPLGFIFLFSVLKRFLTNSEALVFFVKPKSSTAINSHTENAS